ncbi:MAG: Gfo/Idh/MocA family oxidoreductase [Nocardioidaceae bacterium]|nr:Gfo/Idh/MocA family oxidoreductase [Nocardioidaceae bacterium]
MALVGAGAVAQRHARVLSDLAGVEVVAVADPVTEAAQELADEVGARAYEDAEQALDASPVDGVYVCVPPFAHGPAEEAALSRGLPLFVEKPVALNLATAEALARRVEEVGVVTGTGYHWRCLDLVESARKELADSPPLMASGYWLDKRPPVAWWGQVDRSGGQVVEQLTHILDVARLLLGEAVEVYAAGAFDDAAAQLHSNGSNVRVSVDDATAATVRFASGAVATFAATSVLASKHRAALHTVSRGLLLELSETCLISDDGFHRLERVAGEDPKVTVDAEFIAAVRGELGATRVPYAEAVRTQRLACAIAESAATGQRVVLNGRAAPAGAAVGAESGR